MSRGIQRERAVRDILQNDDWVVIRAAGSLGAVDLVALKAGHKPMFIEVKSTHRGPYHGFGPADRRDISVRAAWAGADAWLLWWPPSCEPSWIPEAAWPKRHLEAVA